jgi:sugar/nucleoside kinase (ribokinase family)
VTPRLVIAGNLLIDDLVLPSGLTRLGEPGGAVLYAALAASLWGSQVGCASLCGDDYPPLALLALGGRGVDLEGVRQLDGAGGRTWLLYEEAARHMVPRLGSPSHAAVSPRPEHLPAQYWQARACHLAPMPLSSQRELARALGKGEDRLLTLDPHLPIREDTLADWRPVLERVDIIFPAEEELQLDGLQEDPRAALRRLAGGRLRYVVLKRGERGGLLYDLARERLQKWQPRASAVVDPTGAGDAFAAGFITALLDGQEPAAALQRALVSASFARAGWGPLGLRAATPAAAQKRLQQWSVGAAGAGAGAGG